MYLKSLELQGFKSFPDKVTLSFDKGVTAVVGPNGSGKSNISDAVRWVLGEQSTKTLRGSKMEDVIFSGTQKRRAMGFAAVTLNIDNSEGTISDIGSDIAVTRKYYRSGDSEYMLNGKHVRLRDIHELFMDTGLGRDGYSMIGQGRVSEIVGVKSEERRNIFEEAAGVSKFRYKKEEAQRRLASAEDNLVRIQDIVSELEGRIEPLKNQSEKAKQFLELASEQKRKEISLWNFELDTLKEKKDEYEQQYSKCRAELGNLELEAESAEEKINEGYERLQRIDIEIESARSELSQTQQSASELEAGASVYENDIKHMQEQISRIEKQIEDEEKDARSGEKESQKRREQIEELKILFEKESAELEKTDKEIEIILEKSAELGRKSESEKEQLMKLYGEQSRLKTQADTLLSTIEGSDTEGAELLEAEKKLEEELSERMALLEAENASLCGIDEKIAQTMESIRKKEHELSEASEKIKEYRLEFNKISADIKDREQRGHILSDLERNMEGFSGSVKSVMRASESGRLNGIAGTSAQLLSAASEYGMAVETALGGAMQNIIVENESSAKEAIRYLKETRGGRCTFLPLTSIKGKTLEHDLSSEKGFIGNAWKLVSYDEKYADAIKYLLGRVAVADNIDNAAVIAKKYRYSFRIVTLDGQVINAGGSFTGGSAQRSGGMITRRAEIDRLSSELKGLEAEYKELNEELEYMQKNFEIKSEALEEERAFKLWQETEKIKISSRREQINFAAEQIKARIADEKKKYSDIQSRTERDRKNLELCRAEFEKTEKKLDDLQKRAAESRDETDSYAKKRDELSAQKSHIQIKATSLEKDIEALCKEDEAAQLRSGDRLRRRDILREEIAENKKNISEYKEKIRENRESAEKMRSDAAEIEKKSIRLRTSRDMQDKSIRTMQDGMKETIAAKEKFSSELVRIDERRSSASAEYDKIINRLLEDYEMTRSEAAAAAEPVEDQTELKREIQELKNRIKKLGSVSVDSIEEYKNVSKRYRFMSEQLKDIRSSKKELEDLIARLTDEMSTVFSESFGIINRNFKEIFAELFGGGKAELRLTDPENVLESGIDIIVAPPGKVIKNLISLSGGEQAFIAIAIYFAILRLRPAPFCILDEIDAALDEANVKKYARYLRNFTDTTQFILVTHRRGAMEEAGILYGVTMQEDGISKLLKLDQREALEQTSDN